MVHKKISKKVKKAAKSTAKAVKGAVKKAKGKVANLLSLVNQVWKLIPNKTRKRIHDIVIEEGRSQAIDFTCNIIEAETGFPSNVCDLIADKIVDLAIDKFD